MLVPIKEKGRIDHGFGTTHELQKGLAKSGSKSVMHVGDYLGKIYPLIRLTDVRFEQEWVSMWLLGDDVEITRKKISVERYLVFCIITSSEM